MKVLVVSNDLVGTRMAGVGIRAWELSHQLSRRFDVTLVVPEATDLPTQAFEQLVLPAGERRLLELARSFDAVVAQWLPPFVMTRLAGSGTKTVYDLYDPVMMENLALHVGEGEAKRLTLNIRATNLVQQIALETGDAFVCASEKQRDLWLGFLGAIGRLDDAAYAHDPTLRSLIDIVPFGIASEPPQPGPPVLKGVVPGIRETDRVLLWGGGIWDWLDPLTVIRAVAALARERDDVRLFFLGGRHPHAATRVMPMAAQARALAEELGVRDRSVFFNEEWVPYEQRAAYLLEADLGVSAHLDHVEARFAYRTRLLDCFWAGIPVVATEGDALAELVAERGLGRVVGFEDVGGWAAAIAGLLDDEDGAREIRLRASALRPELEWPRIVEPLVRLLETSAVERRANGTGRALLEHYLIRARLSVMHRGAAGAVLAAAARLGVRREA